MQILLGYLFRYGIKPEDITILTDSHKLIEKEFYQLEGIKSKKELI